MAAWQGAGRLERAERDDLRPRATAATTTPGPLSATTAGATTTCCRSSSARRTSTAARPSTTAPAGHSGCSRATSRIRSAQRSSPRRRRRASPSTTTTTASTSTASRSAQLNIKDGRRQTAATAFLAPVSATAKLTVLTGAHARRLLFEGGRCVGVELAHEGAVAHIRAEREVVVSRRHHRVGQAAAALGHRPGRRARPARRRRGRRPAGRRAEPARPPALAGHLQRLADGAAGRSRPPAAAQPSLLAQPPRPAPPPTSSRSSSTCRCTSKAWRGRPTATR